MHINISLLHFLTIVSYLSLFGWIYLFFFHGRKSLFNDVFFWSSNIIFEKNCKSQKNEYLGKKTCVIIPARNEEKTILKTLQSLKNQNNKNFEIIVINDNSSDRTSLIVKKFKQTFSKLKLLNGKKLPPGWVGKTWALKQGVDLANKKKFDYYMFLDSDIVLSENLLNKVISFLNSHNYLMISLMAKLNCKFFWEKMLIPPFIFFFQKLYPFNLVNNEKSKVSAAAGGFIFCKVSAFKNENLYNFIKNKLIDDCNIAELLKQKGKIWLGLTNEVVSKRSYKNIDSIWKMVSRTAFEQLKYSLTILTVSLIGLFILFISPIILIFLCLFFLGTYEFINQLLFLNFMSVVIMIIILIPTLKFYNVKIFYSLTFPFATTLYLCMTISSVTNHFFNSGNSWKGRKY